MDCSTIHTLPLASTKKLENFPVGISLVTNLGFGNKKGVSISDLNLSYNTNRGGTRRPNGRKPTYYYSPRCNISSQLSSEIAPITSAAYGVLLLGGGLFAYTRTGSKGSLFGGLTGACLMGTAYFLMQVSETKEIGEALAFGSALLFASVFGIRLAATRKIMPAGPLLALSIFAVVLFISAYLQEAV